MLMVISVTFSDRLLLDFFQREANHSDGVRLRYEEIAELSGIPERTVQRAVTRLADAGLICITREPGDCYVYKVINHEQQSA